MLPAADRLALRRAWPNTDDATFLVPGVCAVVLCEREGCRRLDADHVLRLLAGLDREGLRELRAFVARLGLCGRPMATMDDARVLSIVRGHVRAGGLVGVREDGKAGGGTDQGTVRQRQLVRKIDAALQGRLSLRGRSYKLVADVDLNRIPRRQDYEVVGHDEAARVLAELSAQQDTAGRELLSQASANLTRDWRAGISQPDGLVLVRRIPVVAATGVESAPVTPSQLAKLRAEEASVNLEVVVLGLDDKPLSSVAYVIESPDGETHEADLGASGKAKITSSKKGAAAVTLAWADGKVRS